MGARSENPVCDHLSTAVVSVPRLPNTKDQTAACGSMDEVSRVVICCLCRVIGGTGCDFDRQQTYGTSLPSGARPDPKSQRSRACRTLLAIRRGNLAVIGP